MARQLTRKRITGSGGITDYRIGDFAVIKEDERIVDPIDHDGVDVLSEVTWGVLPWATYERRHGDVGLPDCQYEFGTLREAQAHIQRLHDKEGEV